MDSPKRAPEYKLVRIATGSESGTFSAKIGINCANNQKLLVQLVPCTNTKLPADGAALTLSGATSNPTAEVYYWNALQGVFVKHNTPQTIAAAGAGVASEFEVDAYGRIVHIAITGGVTGGQGVAIFAAVFESREPE